MTSKAVGEVRERATQMCEGRHARQRRRQVQRSWGGKEADVAGAE